MAASVTAVAPVQILLAVTCKVSHLVAFVALLATAATTAELSVAGSSRAATASANVLAIAGIMARPVTLEARISRHSETDGWMFLCFYFTLVKILSCHNLLLRSPLHHTTLFFRALRLFRSTTHKIKMSIFHTAHTERTVFFESDFRPQIGQFSPGK